MGGGGYLGESIQGAIYEQGPSPGEIDGGVNSIGEWYVLKKNEREGIRKGWSKGYAMKGVINTGALVHMKSANEADTLHNGKF
jgi:hypothetical protein